MSMYNFEIIEKAWADEAPAAKADHAFSGLLPILLILMVFYFLVIRPQQHKHKEQTRMWDSLNRGTKVVTNSGFLVTVIDPEGDEFIIVEIAPGVEVKMRREAIAEMFRADARNMGKPHKGKYKPSKARSREKALEAKAKLQAEKEKE